MFLPSINLTTPLFPLHSMVPTPLMIPNYCLHPLFLMPSNLRTAKTTILPNKTYKNNNKNYNKTTSHRLSPPLTTTTNLSPKKMNYQKTLTPLTFNFAKFTTKLSLLTTTTTFTTLKNTTSLPLSTNTTTPFNIFKQKTHTHFFIYVINQTFLMILSILVF